MNFYDTGNPYNSLVHYVNDLLNLPSADTSEYTLAQKARAANTAKNKLGLLLWLANDAWEFDDGGNTDLPIATADLVVGQRDYSLPTTALSIERAEIMDQAGNYHRITAIDETDIPTTLTNYGESNGFPLRYWVKGRSLFLDPAPATGTITTTAGIKLYFARSTNTFTTATTTTNVGFDEPGDRAIAYMVALEYAARKGKEIASWLNAELYGPMGFVTLLQARQSRRLMDRKPKIRIHIENME